MINTANRVGYDNATNGSQVLKATNPATQELLEGDFVAATTDEVELAVEKAHQAWKSYRNVSGEKKAAFLRAIADEIEGLGDELVERVMAESGLPEGRVRGERGRTCNQLRLFATIVAEGSWVDAVIDPALPDRQPMPRVDIRRMLQAMGPVVVFTASNFPLAFSTAGGDTASALAAGCPVIVKAHPSHLGTNALISEAILRAAQKQGLPDGIFSSLQDGGYEVGTQLVRHAKVKAVAFTGSLRGGMALHKAAMNREEPIPVFAEMGSTNPIFIMPELITQKGATIAEQITGSVNLGAGQFCTNPGLVITIENEATPDFLEGLQNAFTKAAPATMLNQGIFQGFESQKVALLAEKGVELGYQFEPAEKAWKGFPALAFTSGENFLNRSKLQEEVFGPFTLVVRCKDYEELNQVAEQLHGQLTATIMGEESALDQWTGLINILQEKVGRLLFNGVPTGVEVGYAMQHGGPFPATTDSRFTSVGTDAIKRFARPIAFQNCPDPLLPDALKEGNPLKINRTVNGELMKG